MKITDLTPAPGKKYSHQYPPFGTSLIKQMKIIYIVDLEISCVNETTKRIDLKASPAVQFTPLNSVCEEVMPYVITQVKETNRLAGTGTYSGAGINATALFNPQHATAGMHTIRYNFLAANNCTAFAVQNIIVFPQLKVNAGPDRTMIRGGLITLDATASDIGLQYEWTPNINIDNNKIFSPGISPLVNTTYTLKATSTDGYNATDEVVVIVLKDIYVPSALSPNGDCINDIRHIPFLDAFSGTDVKVFNRYGEMVYQSAGQSIARDGQFKGKPLPAGSYLWVLNVGALKKQVHGTVMIVR